MKVYDFIKAGLNKFNNDPLYTAEVKKICLDLNETLNNPPCDIDYVRYLEQEDVSNKIDLLYKRIFLELHDSMYVDLSDIVFLLKDFQANRKIAGERYRDHFYHSIQCFLLGITLYKTLSALDKSPRGSDVLITIFSICMYHDLGYLYKTSGSIRPCINDDMRSRFDCKDNWDKANKLKELLCIKETKTQNFMQCCSSCKVLALWKEETTYEDNDVLRNLLDVQFGKNYEKTSLV